MTNDEWFEQHRLIHYTDSVDTVRSILELGFLLVPNKRRLISKFLPDDDFSTREPQEFGMASFTELRIEDATRHRESFGDFGLCVSWNWAIRHGAQRVIYITDGGGAVFDTLHWLFKLGRQEVDRVAKGAVDHVMLENKAVSGGMGAQLYHALLTLYEYMEPERNSSQLEWRVVEKSPFYHRSTTRAGLVKEVLETAKAWKACCAPIEPSDIEMLVCPMSQRKRLRDALPARFENVPVYSYSAAGGLSEKLHGLGYWLLELRRCRDRVEYVPYSPPKGSVLLRKTTDGRATLLPWVKNLCGVALHPDSVASEAWFDYQYEDEAGTLFEAQMRVGEARKLLGFLLQLEQIGWQPPS